MNTVMKIALSGTAILLAASITLGADSRRLKPSNVGAHTVGTVVESQPPADADPCPRRSVSTADELESVLRSDFKGCVIVSRDARINMDGRCLIPIRAGVSLIGERGAFGSRPELLWTERWMNQSTGCKPDQVYATHPDTPHCRFDNEYKLFIITEGPVSISSLHLHGPMQSRDKLKSGNSFGICIQANTNRESAKVISITDNELSNWHIAAVEINGTCQEGSSQNPRDQCPSPTPSRDNARFIQIQHNYFHHNVMDGQGYGVKVNSRAYALIEGNVFDKNRHAISAEGKPNSGYIVKHNYFLEGGFKDGLSYQQHIDVHGAGEDKDGDGKVDDKGYGGSAGDYFEVSNNTIRGEQNYLIIKTRPSFMVRGRPVSGAFFRNNVDVHDDLDAAVSLKSSKRDSGIGERHSKFNFSAEGNRFNLDLSGELAVGEFDGDGIDDVLVTTGTAWFYSSGGRAPWQFLQASEFLIGDLCFADVDHDGQTDILGSGEGGEIFYAKSGREPFKTLTTAPTSVHVVSLRVGDFDGDGHDDLFYTQDGIWRIWYGGSRRWEQLQGSHHDVSELLFGEFDGVRGTDVAAVTGDAWAISSGARGTFATGRINNALRRSFKNAVAADFDGDGRTDIAFFQYKPILNSQNLQAQGFHWKWEVSRNGQGRLEMLYQGQSAQDMRGFPAPIVGHFESGASARVLGYSLQFVRNSDRPNHFFAFGKSAKLAVFSWAPMR